MKVNTDYLKKVLYATMKATDCEVAICGGDLRDLDHGIESKDLDVFVLVPPVTPDTPVGAFGLSKLFLQIDADSDNIEDKKLALDTELRKQGLVNEGLSDKPPRWYGNGKSSGSNMRDDVIGVQKYWDEELDYVFMGADNWPQITENFDVSICQIICCFEDEKLNIYASDSYMAHKRGEGDILRFYNIPTCDSHVARIKAKFGKVKGVYTNDGTLNLVGELTEEGIVYHDK